jgi:hypothetical protein
LNDEWFGFEPCKKLSFRQKRGFSELSILSIFTILARSMVSE